MKIFFSKLIGGVLLTMVVSACISSGKAKMIENTNDDSAYSTAEHYALKLGAEHIKKNYPEYYTENKKIMLTERDDVWVVEYRLPAFMVGGSPVVEIDKKNEQVVKMYRTQ